MTHPDPSATPGPAPAARTECTNAPATAAGSAPAMTKVADSAPDTATATGSAPDTATAIASATATASADDRRAVTGKRRIAFAVHVAGAGELPGLRTLLRSLALSDPALCEDVVVLHPGLPDAAFDTARRLHPG